MTKTICLIYRLGHGPMFLGSTDIDKQLLFSKFCSILSPSYLSGWMGGWTKWDDNHLSQKLQFFFTFD